MWNWHSLFVRDTDGTLICAAQGSDSSRDESICDVASDTFTVFYERTPHATRGVFFFSSKTFKAKPHERRAWRSTKLINREVLSVNMPFTGRLEIKYLCYIGNLHRLHHKKALISFKLSEFGQKSSHFLVRTIRIFIICFTFRQKYILISLRR